MASCVTLVFICSAHAQDFTAAETALKGGVAPLKSSAPRSGTLAGNADNLQERSHKKEPIKDDSLRESGPFKADSETGFRIACHCWRRYPGSQL